MRDYLIKRRMEIKAKEQSKTVKHLSSAKHETNGSARRSHERSMRNQKALRGAMSYSQVP